MEQISRDKFPSNGGWKFRQPQFGNWENKMAMVGFDASVKEIQKARESNRALSAKHGLSTTYATIARELIQYNQRIRNLPVFGSPLRWTDQRPDPARVNVQIELSADFKRLLRMFDNTFDCRRSHTWLAAAEFIQRNKAKSLVETGCYHGVPADGGGTILLAQLAKETGGRLDSYELEIEHIRRCQAELQKFNLGQFVSFHPGDSVQNLACRDSAIDFAYLDSYDCGERPDHSPCQEHQLAELDAILPLMERESAILLDDNLGTNGKTYLSRKRIQREPFENKQEGYQCLYTSENSRRFVPSPIAVLTGHLSNYGKLAAQTIYRNKSPYCVRHGYGLKVMRHFPPEFYQPENKYQGFSWARLGLLLRMVESGKYDWIWVVGCDVLITNLGKKLEEVTALAGSEHHILMCGEAVAPLQADSFLVRSSPQSADWIRTILDCHSQYKNQPWIDNQAMIDLKDQFSPITRILPQYVLNAFDYSLFYHLGDIYRKGKDCYGNRGQWQRGDFVIHWPAQNLETRLGLESKFRPEIVT